MRRLGIKRIPPGLGVVIPGRSVHGFGMRQILAVVGVDRTGSVVDVRLLSPNDVVTIDHAVAMIEVPLRSPLLILDRGDKVVVGRVR